MAEFQVAIERTKGNLGKAIDLLRSYVDTFMTDREAWEELADLYVQVDTPHSKTTIFGVENPWKILSFSAILLGFIHSVPLQAQMYSQAAFCYEELLLHTPQNVALYVQYADVLYTIGGSSVRTAHQYYAAAIKLSGGENVRALYGVCCAAATLAAQKVASAYLPNASLCFLWLPKRASEGCMHVFGSFLPE